MVFNAKTKKSHKNFAVYIQEDNIKAASNVRYLEMTLGDKMELWQAHSRNNRKKKLLNKHAENYQRKYTGSRHQ